MNEGTCMRFHKRTRQATYIDLSIGLHDGIRQGTYEGMQQGISIGILPGQGAFGGRSTGRAGHRVISRSVARIAAYGSRSVSAGHVAAGRATSTSACIRYAAQ